MQIDWSAFVSALLGTTIPGLLVSVLLLVLNNRSTKSIESYKVELNSQLTELQHILAHDEAKARLWHERRVNALVEIYLGFVEYAAFLRKALYVEDSRASMDPYFSYRRTLEKNALFLGDELNEFIHQLAGELLSFWNWAHAQRRDSNPNHAEVQQQLDYDIPQMLERLRVKINEFADPEYRLESGDLPA